MKICLSRWCFMVFDGVVCLSKLAKLRFSSQNRGLDKIHYLYRGL